MRDVVGRRGGICLLSLGLLLLAGTGALMAEPSSRDEIVARYFRPEEVTSWRDFAHVRYRLFMLEQVMGLAFLGALAFTGLGTTLARRVQGITGGSDVLQWCAMALLIQWGLSILCIPLDYYRGFVLEHQRGLSTQTVGSWIQDLLLETSLTSAGLVLVVGWLRICHIRFSPWWLWGGAGLFLGMAGVFFIQPIFLAPLFNSYVPLEEGEFRSGVMDITKRAGIPVSEVYVIDASKRTRRYNAFFMGLGASRTIALYDTLVKGVPRAEALTVVAHEAGHWKRHHVLKGLLMWGAAILVLLFALDRGQGWTGSLAALPDCPRILLAMQVALLLSLPIENGISRYIEAEADMESLLLTGDGPATARMEAELARANQSNLLPHPLVEWFLYTHPPVPDRIRMALEFKP